MLSPAQHRALIRAATATHSPWAGSTLATREALYRKGMITSASAGHYPGKPTPEGEFYVAGYLAALKQLKAPRKRGYVPVLVSSCWRLSPP